MTTANESPEEVLAAFCQAMYEWELDCWRRSQNIRTGKLEEAEAYREGLDALRKIFERYCTTFDENGRGVSYTRPPEYSPGLTETVSVNEVSPGRIEIHTVEREGLKNGYIYTLVESATGWKLARKQKVLGINGKILDSVL